MAKTGDNMSAAERRAAQEKAKPLRRVSKPRIERADEVVKAHVQEKYK